MRIHAMRWSVCGVLALGLGLLATRSFSADEEDKKKTAAAREAIIKLSQGKGTAKDVAAKHELENVMNGFKLRSKDGIGVGNPMDNIKPDGIESKIQSLSKKELPPGGLKKEAPALMKMIQITRAIGDVAAYYPDAAKKDPKAWKRFNEEMIKSAKDMEDAIKASDPTRLKQSVTKLNAACNDCHEKFR